MTTSYINTGETTEQAVTITAKPVLSTALLQPWQKRLYERAVFSGFVQFLGSHRGQAWLRKNRIKRVSK